MKRLIIAVTALLFSIPAFAQLTTAQMVSLRTLALADGTAATYVIDASPSNDALLAAWLNVATTKIVWRTSLMPDVMRNALVDGASQLDNLTAGKRDALLFLVAGELPNTTTLRTTLDDLCGTQATLKSSIQAAEKRASTRAEGALATGTGTTASPATMTFEGSISQGEASQIRSQ